MLYQERLPDLLVAATVITPLQLAGLDVDAFLLEFPAATITTAPSPVAVLIAACVVNKQEPEPPRLRLSTRAGLGLEGAPGTAPPAATTTTIPASTSSTEAATPTSGNPVVAGPDPAATGDGYTITPIGDRVYNVFHHNTAQLTCSLKSKPVSCFDGGVVGYYFLRKDGATAPTALTAGDAAVQVGMRSVVTHDAATNRMWIVGTDQVEGVSIGTQGGFACMDLSTSPPTACPTAWVPTGKAVMESQTGYPDINFVGSDTARRRIYSIDQDYDVHCLDMSTSALCSGWAVTHNAFPTIPGSALASQGVASLMPGTTKIVIAGHDTNSSAYGVDYVTCIDSVSGARCTGWPADPIVLPGESPSSAVTGFPFPKFDAGVTTPSAVCLYQGSVGISQWWEMQAGSLSVSCVSLANGNSDGVPPNFANSLPADTTLTPGGLMVGDWALTANGRMYQTWLNNATGADRWTCYDFKTGDACSGWANGLDVSGATWDMPYGVTVDDVLPNCIWSLGDQGYRRPFNAITGGAC